MPQATDAVWLSVLPDMSGFGPGLAAGSAGAADSAGAAAGKKFGKALLAGVAVVAGGAALATTALYNVGKTFDEMGDTIRVGTGATGDALNGLIDVAKNVGKKVPAEFDAIGTVVADVNTRLGLSGKTLETVASQYLEAGRILGEDVDIQKTSAAFSAFKIEGDAVVGAMDTLFQVSQATGVGINDLAASVQTSAPAVQALGFSFEESAALVGTLDKAGLNSTQTLSAMSKGLVTLAKDGEEPQEAFRRVTGEIDALIKSGDTAGAIDLASGIFGTRAAVNFVGAVDSGTLALDDLVAGAGATSDTILGVADETADLTEKWQIFKNRALLAIEPVATRVFDALTTGMSWIVDVGVPALQRFGDQVKNGFTGDLEGALTPMEKVGAAARSVFDYIKLTAIPAIRDFGGWVQKNSGWLIPLGAGIAAIAASIGLVVGALKVWRAITVAFTAVQAALNVVLALNPIGIIVLAIVGLVAAFVVAYKRSETFRDIVQGAWEGIKNAATTAWDWIRDKVFAPISTGLQAVGGAFVSAKDGISTAMSAVGSALSWVYDNVIKPVWDGIQTAISFAWGVIKPILDAHVAVFKFLGEVFWNVWTLVIQVAWLALQAAFQAGWDFIRTFIFDPLRLAWDAIGAAFSWVWANIIAPVWATLQTVLTAGWNFIRDYVFSPINQGVAALGDAFTAAKDTAGRAWDGLKSAASAAWTWIKDNVFSPFGTAIGAIGDAFNTAADVVGKAWDAIQGAAVKPVNFVIETVYNNGIKALFDTVAEKLGLSQRLPSISKIGSPPSPAQNRATTAGRPAWDLGMATGGVLPGYTPGRDVHDFYSPTAGWLHLSGGEGILRPEAVRDLGGAAGIAAINSRYTGRGAGGGKAFFLGGIWDAVKNGAGAAWDFTTDAASAIGNFMKDPVAGAVKVFSKPIEELLKKIGGGDVGQIIAGAPRALIKGIIDGATRIFGPARDDGTDPAKGGRPGPGGAAMGWQAMTQALRAIAPGVQITSGFRPGAKVAGTNIPSMHGLGRAIDLAPSMATFNKLLAAYPNATELLYSPAGSRQRQRGAGGSFAGDTTGTTRAMHFNHIHWGMRNGGVVPNMPTIQGGVFDNGGMLQPGGIAVNLSNRPEPVFSSQQWETMRTRESGPVVGEINVTSSDPEAAARAVVRRFEDAASLSDLDMIAKGF